MQFLSYDDGFRTVLTEISVKKDNKKLKIFYYVYRKLKNAFCGFRAFTNKIHSVICQPIEFETRLNTLPIRLVQWPGQVY